MLKIFLPSAESKKHDDQTEAARRKAIAYLVRCHRRARLNKPNGENLK